MTAIATGDVRRTRAATGCTTATAVAFLAGVGAAALPGLWRWRPASPDFELLVVPPPVLQAVAAVDVGRRCLCGGTAGSGRRCLVALGGHARQLQARLGASPSSPFHGNGITVVLRPGGFRLLLLAPWWCFGSVGSSSCGGVAEVAWRSLLPCPWAGGGSSAVGRRSSLVTVGMMTALLWRRSPCWGHHVEAIRSRCEGLSG
jgi:hypothetical protein